MDRNQASQITAGLVLVGLGLLFLGQRLHLISVVDITRLWPLILIAIGVARFFGPRMEGQPRGGAWLMFIGALFLADTFHVLSLSQSWPLFIVAGGVSIMLGSRKGSGGPSVPANGTRSGTTGGN